jgi:hypothetical protein
MHRGVDLNMPPIRRAMIALIFASGSWSCDSITGPSFPADQIIATEPLPIFREWWKLVEACAGRTGDFTTIHWYTTRGSPLVLDGQQYNGYWFGDGNRIVIANLHDGQTVRHEMLHAILQRGDHPLDAFAGTCDGVVSFSAPEDYGVPQALASQAKVLSASEALTIQVKPLPAEPSASAHDGKFTFDIIATNNSGAPVWVPIPDGYTASYIVREHGYGTAMLTKAQRVFFDVGQVRHVLLDAGVDSAGTYHVRAGYARALTDWVPVTVVP